MRHTIVVLLAFSAGLAVAQPAAAQVLSRPTDPPVVTAENESWFQQREPMQFAGDLYYPAGATVFFNRNTMVRTGHYNGVPIYSDTTLEPYSVVYVPVSRGLMQPYERLRRGDLAGTTGSRAPSFPVNAVPSPRDIVIATVAPTAPPLPIGAISVFTPDSTPVAAAVALAPAPAIEPASVFVPRSREYVAIVSVREPESNDGVWIRFGGEKWVADGMALPFREAEYSRVGEYAGFPVYQHAGETRIYLPTREGVVAPYRRK